LGVKLDWHIETERIHKRLGEDPDGRKIRRRSRRRIIALTTFMIVLVGGIGGALLGRLRYVDDRIRQDLTDTIEAEIAALRIGNYPDFIALQRSASDAWFTAQSERFQRYQDQKTTANLTLTGAIHDLVIDGPRGRVVLGEIVNNVPFETVWFYWRYSDGWRHVPADYTFWGELITRPGTPITVTFYALDVRLGEALANRANRWWTAGCIVLDCQPSDPMTLHVAPDPSAALAWDTSDPNRLIIPSPLAIFDRARADADMPQALEDAIAQKLAEAMFNDVVAGGAWQNEGTLDAAWLRSGVIEWAAASLTERGDPLRMAFMASYQASYGASAVAKLAAALTPERMIQIAAEVVGQPIDLLAVDWHPFFQWRLDVEKTLLSRGDQGAVIPLWDTQNPAAAVLLRDRLANPGAATGQVQSVRIAMGNDGIPRAYVAVTVEGTPAALVFAFIEGTWRRSV